MLSVVKLVLLGCIDITVDQHFSTNQLSSDHLCTHFNLLFTYLSFHQNKESTFAPDYFCVCEIQHIESGIVLVRVHIVKSTQYFGKRKR